MHHLINMLMKIKTRKVYSLSNLHQFFLRSLSQETFCPPPGFPGPESACETHNDRPNLLPFSYFPKSWFLPGALKCSSCCHHGCKGPGSASDLFQGSSRSQVLACLMFSVWFWWGFFPKKYQLKNLCQKNVESITSSTQKLRNLKFDKKLETKVTCANLKQPSSVNVHKTGYCLFVFHRNGALKGAQ